MARQEADASVDRTLEPLILVLRGQRVILDADLARLYGVTTKRFNQGLRRNLPRFPEDFAFQLSSDEFALLRRPYAAQKLDRTKDSTNWSQFVTSSRRHRGAAYRPWALTEHGALMAANVLRSPQAIRMSIFVIRAFVRLHEQATATAVLLKRLAEIEKTPKRRIG